jgi:Putative addiction module component
MAAARVAFCWFGVRKTLTPEQKAQAADTFGAEGQYLSAGKKLLNTRHPAFLAVTNVRHQLVATWQSMSLPYPEAAVRLIRQDKIDEFNRRMSELRQDLDEAVSRLDEHYTELRSAARERLGSLFNPSDYPVSLRGLFGVTWDFPNIEPPSYLEHLNPALYEDECQRVAARFDEAVQLAEQAFVSELTGLVEHLTERLTGRKKTRRRGERETRRGPSGGPCGRGLRTMVGGTAGQTVECGRRALNMSNDEVLQAAMTLPLFDRVTLAQALWASIDEGLPSSDSEDQDAIQEAKRRDAELTSGQAIGRSHEQVMAAARRVLG